MAFLHYTLFFVFISSALEVVESQRNLEAEIDALKLTFDRMKSLHETEIGELKDIIKSQGKEIEKLKENRDLNMRKIRQDMDRCLSSHQNKNEGVADPVLDTVLKKFPETPDIANNIRRGKVPALPYRRDIGLYVRSTAKVIYGREKLRKKEKPGLYVRSTAKVIYGREKLRKKEKPGDRNDRAAFYAYLSHDLVDIGTNQVIEFDHVVTNVGNLYNNTTGVFYCDLPGIYVFHVHILANPHQTVYTVLTKNGERVSYIYAASVDITFSHGGNTAILQLKRGDVIAVRAHDHFTSNGNVIDDRFSSFSGFLLYPEIEPSVVG